MFTKKLILLVGYFVFTPIFIGLTFMYYSGFGKTYMFVDMEQINGRDNASGYNTVSTTETVVSHAVLGAYTIADAIPVVIAKYLQYYNSKIPAEPIIRYAYDYGVDPRLIVAIAQQESNLGKQMPEKCHNAWGYGIHSQGTLCFDSWEEGIKTVTKGIAEKYCQRGLCDDPCVMMKKYTPSSNGSWCYGVNQFLDEMRSGNF